MHLTKSDLAFIFSHFGTIDEYELQPTSEVHGFQGTYYNLKITSNGRISKYFVKTIPEGTDIVNDFYRRSGTFVKEFVVYAKILPRLDGVKTRKIWPKCHVGVEGKYLVLEDMTATGWKMTQNMDFHHIKVALTGLANFHASSLLVERDSDFERLMTCLGETMFSEDDRPGRQMWESFCKIADRILPNSGVSKVLRRVVGKVQPSTEFRNCLNHGDPWMNNMLFRYDRNEPIDVVFVDFQSARYAPPALDIAIFSHIFTPERPLECALLYYKQLELCFRDSQPNPITQSEFLESFEHYKMTGASIAALYVFLTRLPSKYLSEILASQETFITFALGRDYLPAVQALEEDQAYRDDVIRSLQRVVFRGSVNAT